MTARKCDDGASSSGGSMGAPKKMTLDEFEAEVKETLAAFVAEYRKMHEKHPKEWPLKMLGGDWYEQFHFYDPGEGFGEDE